MEDISVKKNASKAPPLPPAPGPPKRKADGAIPESRPPKRNSDSVISRDIQELIAGTNPSSVGRNVYTQEKLGEAGCHNYRTDALPIPLALLHKPFAAFLDDLQNVGLAERDVLFTLEVCRKMRKPFSRDKDRENEFADLLRDYIPHLMDWDTWGKFRTFIQTPGRSVAGIRLVIELNGVEHTIYFTELRREEGHGGNPQYEGIAHCAKECLRTERNQPKPGFLYPALLVNVVGPHIRAYGTSLDGQGGHICEPLTPAMDLLVVPKYPDRLGQLARFFRSIPNLLGALAADYEQASEIAAQGREPLRDAVSEEALPYALRFDETLDCVQRIPDTHVYLCREEGSGAVTVRKFVQRYNLEAHQAWAERGVAPELKGQPISLPGGWMQVGMEYLASDIAEDEGWVPLSRLLLPLEGHFTYKRTIGPLRPGLHLMEDQLACPFLLAQAEQLLALAHSEQGPDNRRFVHGDVRPPNIMVLIRQRQVAGMKLVDCDWAGVHAEARYPVLMNVLEIQWPKGAGPLQRIMQQHDVELLRLQMSRATASAVRMVWRDLPV